MSKFSLFIVMILVIDLVQAISISEVNYNPQGDDNNKEYIEIYSQEPINLSNYTIEDLSSLDVLTLVKSSNSSYYLVVEENFDHTQIDATIYTVGPTIGNNLNNDNDQITLKDSNGSIIETFTYTSEIGANNNNKSLCKFPESTGNWQECIQTPGLVNQIEIINIENNTQNSTIGNNNTIIENNSGQTNNLNPTIIINEIMPNPIGDDSMLPGGEWIELYNKGPKIDINGLILRDSSGKKIEINKDSTLGSTIINEYLIVYTGSKSGFLNNKDEQIIELLSNEKVIDFIKGKNKELPSEFNSKEQQHLWDVRGVVKILTIILYSLIALFILLLFISAFTLKINNYIINFVGKVLLFGGFLTILLAALVFLLINYDFSTAFESFHTLLFQKGTYTFDPAKEVIVKLYPEQFFMDIGAKISKEVIAVSAVIILLGSYLIFKSKNKKNK